MDNIINKTYTQFNLKKHDYFVLLQSGHIDKKSFISSQEQMYWAVEFFSKPMSILASKIPDINLRADIIKNIWEEHGNGNVQLAHANTFISFLSKLGVSDNTFLQIDKTSAGVNAFNAALIGACYFHDYKVSAAVLGMIEKLFVDASNIINNTIIANNWLSAEEIVHYDIHESLDVEHAKDFFRVFSIEDNSGINLLNIEQGLRLGGHIFNKLYDELLIIASNN